MTIKPSSRRPIRWVNKIHNILPISILSTNLKSIPLDKPNFVPNLSDRQNPPPQRFRIQTTRNALPIFAILDKTRPIRQNPTPIHPILNNRRKRTTLQKTISLCDRSPCTLQRKTTFTTTGCPLYTESRNLYDLSP